MLGRNDDSVLGVALDLEVSGKRERRGPKNTWKKQMEEETREDWFEEGGCPPSRQVERQSASNCRRNGVNPATSAKGTPPNKN